MMPFKNKTNKSLEITFPVSVQLSLRFWIEPGEELGAEAVNNAVDQLAHAADDDVFYHPKISGDYSMNVLGVEPGGKVNFYNRETEGEAPMPDGVRYAPPMFAHILTIDHRYGTSTSAHLTAESATAELAHYCRICAIEADITNSNKLQDHEIIENYFAVMNERDEFYSIERTVLHTD